MQGDSDDDFVDHTHRATPQPRAYPGQGQNHVEDGRQNKKGKRGPDQVWVRQRTLESPETFKTWFQSYGEYTECHNVERD